MRNSSGQLLVSVYSGLGNRMRVLLSAEETADRLGMDFSFHWKKERNFTADLSDLWLYDRARVGIMREFVFRMQATAVSSYQGIVEADEAKRLYISGQQPIEGESQRGSWQDRFRNLEPTAEILDRVLGFGEVALESRNAVGVMVRAHKKTHQVTKESSPPSWFISRMLEISRVNPGVIFFLSCDDRVTQEAIESAVPNVVAQSKNSKYNSSGGVKDAVVDLYLLAACSHIIGPHWSSFVEMSLALARPSTGFETPVTQSVTPIAISSVPRMSALFQWM